MQVIVTEMGPAAYVVTARRGNCRRTMRMTPNLRDAILQRGRQLWRTPGFGSGKIGGQAQYDVSKQ